VLSDKKPLSRKLKFIKIIKTIVLKSVENNK